jgi:transposase
MGNTVTKIVGIDISKLKFDACLLIPGAKPVYAVFSNDQTGYAKLLAWLEFRQALDAHLCMEATGVYGLALANVLHGSKMLASVVNPFMVKAFGQSELSRNKTDRADAHLIARFCISKMPRPWSPPSPTAVRLRSLTNRYQALHEDRTRIICRLEAVFDEEARTFWKGRLSEIDTIINGIQRQLRELRTTDGELARQFRLLTSIPGIGEITALQLLAEIPDVRAFRNAKQLAAFAGLTPINRSSGTFVWKQPRLSKRGSPTLRRILYMPAMCARRYNEPLRAFAENLLQRGKAKMAVIGALMRKLLHCVYGVLKSGQLFDADKAVAVHKTA